MTNQSTPIVISPDCDISLLVVAVVMDAKRQAAKGDRDARQWLKTEGAEWIDAILDIHPDHFQKWARSTRYKPARRKTDPRRWEKYKAKPKPAQLVTAP